MTKITEIYLDLDDVLTDLSRYLLKVLRDRISGFSDKYSLLSKYNWWESHTTYENLFGTMCQHDWDDLPSCAYSNQIYSLCSKSVGVTNVFICTCPTSFIGCLQGKFNWCQRHFDIPIQNFIPIVHKEKLATSNRLLIDDKLSNCINWRKKGGLANVYSRPWSDKNWQNSRTDNLTEAEYEEKQEEMAFNRFKLDLESVMGGTMF